MESLKQRVKKSNVIDNKSIQKYPKNMLVELTNNCNHKCIFCENRKMTRQKGFIKKDFLLKILKEAYSLGTREVGYYATGEPLMDKNLLTYVKMAKEIGYEYVYITTNGALITEAIISEIIEAGIDSIKFSINAGKKETYRIIHGQNDFEKVISNLKKVFEIRSITGKDFKIYVSFVRTKQNEYEYEELRNIVGDYVDEIIVANVYNQGGNMYEINGILTLEENYKPINAPCSMVFNRFHITYEGYLNICCVDFQNYLAVANLNNVSLKEAWNCNVMQEIRKKHLENNLQGVACYNCINNSQTEIRPLVEEYATYRKKELDKEIISIKKRLDLL